jgi:hypothetical protein
VGSEMCIRDRVCSSVKAVKYLYKYSYKGPDRINVSLQDIQDQDEIQDYLDCRYISPPEACWRIFGFAMHGQSHSVEKLPVNLENFQTILFSEDANNAELLETLERGSITKLTAFFQVSAIDPIARGLLYHELPEKYKWDQPSKSWRLRTNRKKVVARMYNVNPSEGERYYLRILLCHIKGPTSFTDLRTYNGVIYPNYKDAAIARGLLEDDNEWINCLNEACLSASPNQLRFLFATILNFGNPRACKNLWDRFYPQLSEDSLISDENEKLCDTVSKINKHLEIFGKRLSQFIECIPDVSNDLTLINYFNQEALQNIAKLNANQKDVFDTVITAAASTSANDSKVFFLDGPGGLAKHLYIIAS